MKWISEFFFFFLLSTLIKYSARNPQQDPRELQDTFGWKKGCRSQDGKRTVGASLDPGRFPFEKIPSKRKDTVVKKTSERSAAAAETCWVAAKHKLRRRRRRRLTFWVLGLKARFDFPSQNKGDDFDTSVFEKLTHWTSECHNDVKTITFYCFFLNSPLFFFLLCLLTASEQRRGSRPTHLLWRDPTPRLEPWLPPPGGEAKNTFFKKRFDLLGSNQILFIYPPSGPVTWSPILCCCCCVHLSLPTMTLHNNQRHQLLIPEGSLVVSIALAPPPPWTQLLPPFHRHRLNSHS